MQEGNLVFCPVEQNYCTSVPYGPSSHLRSHGCVLACRTAVYRVVCHPQHAVEICCFLLWIMAVLSDLHDHSFIRARVYNEKIM